MSQISSLSANRPATEAQAGNSIEDLDLDVFLDLMLTELQNQDPLNPMDNQEMLNTISQIREISANDRLSETLDSVLLGQNVSTASGLIGTSVEALTDSGRRVVGEVRQVTINDGEPQLEVATTTEVVASDSQGGVPEGQYIYSFIWETDQGPIGAQVLADTEQFGDDFTGALRVENLPDFVDGPKSVYRTDSDGVVRRLQTLAPSVLTFTDVYSDLAGEVVDALPPGTQFLQPDSTATVRLSNVGNIKTIEP